MIPEAIGSGAAFFDYDNDGDPDLLLINSNYWPGHEAGDPAKPALYRNDGNACLLYTSDAADDQWSV